MSRLPTIFFGHGSPIIALKQNETTRSWKALADSMERPRAILCISAHWLTHGVSVTAQDHPPTIHDFGGFPREMHEFEYPAPGDPELVARVQQLLGPTTVVPSGDWGFDHGCWTVLMKAWPEADIPVVQLSLDVTKSPTEHYALGQLLRPLRDENVLIMGTGNIVHNLRVLQRVDGAPPNPLAMQFSTAIKRAIAENDAQTVIEFAKLGDMARLAVPTADHFWPLLYVLGARHPDDHVTFEPDFIEYGSIDMTTVTLRGDLAA
ncbi:4,5-DOPA dioxygenase extradiol [Croceicoccus estronivorus]|uniref:4,5-DOPA-extradiol-dioxygenase n=1 Tax=Croceicoccus estronivorus TaxID=1172626 RepID=UPI00083613C6|nr:4,5-DOPA dioxygenase extradiol [Croceicoccus estronivorus]OCC24438.1 4,5-DOPA dioxygenase extradiol [Croceicoccus estronivorus]